MYDCCSDESFQFRNIYALSCFVKILFEKCRKIAYKQDSTLTKVSISSLTDPFHFGKWM